MWPDKRADHGAAPAPGLDWNAGGRRVLPPAWPTAAALLAPSQRALQEPLCFVSLGFLNGGFSSRPLQYKDIPGKLWSFYRGYLSGLIQLHKLSKLDFTCQSTKKKLLNISPDKCSYHQSHPWQYIWTNKQNKRLHKYMVNNSIL